MNTSAGYADHETWVSVRDGEAVAAADSSPKFKIYPIFKVPYILRNCAPEMFCPQVIPIGPLHDIDPPLFVDDITPSLASTYKHMDRFKRLASGSIFNNNTGNFSDSLPVDYVSMVSDYGVYLDDDYLKHHFPNRVAMDACFIAAVLNSLLLENIPFLHDRLKKSRDHSWEYRMKHLLQSIVPIAEQCKTATFFHNVFCKHVSRPERKAIVEDLLLVENQIPFKAVRVAVEFDCGVKGRLLEDLIDLYIASLAHRILPFSKSKLYVFENVQKATEEGHHLLDIVYSIACAHTSMADRVSHGIHVKDTQAKKKHHGAHMRDMPGAKKLRMSGVKIKGHWKSLEKIEFKKGKLSLPRIHVGDDTERYFRNLIAYESQCKPDNLDVISYLHFMDFLIDTPDDVDLLVDERIITQTVGSNKKVAHIWNNLCRNTLCVFSPTYETVANDLNDYCKSPYRLLWAEFYRSKLSRPWMVVSILSAAALLIMTFLILWYTILLYNNDIKSAS